MAETLQVDVGFFLLMIALLFFPPGMVTIAQPSVPYIEKNRCPFECCRFGVWVTRTPLHAYQSEGDTSTPAFSIPQDDTLVAETWNLHIERVGTVLVTKPLLDFKAGDTLSATHCADEGNFEVWHEGKRFDVEVFWKTLYGPGEDDSGSEEHQDSAGVSGIMITRPLVIWWVKVRNKVGDTGWLRLANKTLYCFELEERIDGMDGCN